MHLVQHSPKLVGIEATGHVMEHREVWLEFVRTKSIILDEAVRLSQLVKQKKELDDIIEEQRRVVRRAELAHSQAEFALLAAKGLRTT